MADTRRDPLRLIHAVARTFPHWDYDEMVSAGLVGYARALNCYREETAVPFDAYAAIRVRGAIIGFLRQWNHTRVGHGGIEVLHQFPLSEYVDPVNHELMMQRQIVFRELSPVLRRTVRLYYLYGYSQTQIARKIHVF